MSSIFVNSTVSSTDPYIPYNLGLLFVGTGCALVTAIATRCFQRAPTSAAVRDYGQIFRKTQGQIGEIYAHWQNSCFDIHGSLRNIRNDLVKMAGSPVEQWNYVSKLRYLMLAYKEVYSVIKTLGDDRELKPIFKDLRTQIKTIVSAFQHGKSTRAQHDACIAQFDTALDGLAQGTCSYYRREQDEPGAL